MIMIIFQHQHKRTRTQIGCCSYLLPLNFSIKNFAGVPENYIPLITATTPDVIVETVDQEHLILRYVSQYWNVVINLVIGQPVEADLLGFGKKTVHLRGSFKNDIRQIEGRGLGIF